LGDGAKMADFTIRTQALLLENGCGKSAHCLPPVADLCFSDI
jgi:hypothetical protein